MKRNLIISAIAITSLATFFYFKSQTSSVKRISLDGEYSLATSQSGDTTANQSQADAGLFAAEFSYKPFNKESGEIGMSSRNGIDNPTDNEFRFKIDIDPASKSLAYLEYELYGVKDFSSVCRSVNENLSTGGLFVQLADQWSSQVEMIPASSLRQGLNIVRFSIPDGLEYGYKVKNLRIRFADEMTGERRIVINQTSQKAYYNSFGYVTGFITGDGSQSARIYLDGKEIRNDRAVFEGKVNNGGETSGTWKSSITAVFTDGQEITTEIEFSESQSYDYEGDYCVNAHFAKQYCIAEQSASLEVPGFRLTAESGSVSMPVELSVTGLRSEDMAMMDAAMLNVTGGARGFRCLPHGMQFDKSVEIRIKYDTTKIPIGYGPQDIRTYFYNETSGHWVVLPMDSIDESAHEIVSHSTHFTDFVNGILKTPESPLTEAFTPTSMKDLKLADPLAGFNIISPPTANNQGSANLSYQIEMPAGRQGMQPSLAISYSSESSDGMLGVGWDMSIPAISVETRWGVPRYSPTEETESYLVNGEQLLPMVQRDAYVARSTGDKIFKPRIEGAFEKIIRHGTSPTEYWWEVIDKQGTHYFYGRYSTSTGVEPSCVLAGPNGIAHWALAEVRDMNDNFVRYNYSVVPLGVSAGQPGYGAKQIYPTSIQYTGHGITNGVYKVEFIRDQNLRSDYSVNVSYGFPVSTAYLIKEIKVTYNNYFIRNYYLKYEDGGFDKKRLCCIADLTNTTFITALENAACGTNMGDFTGCKVHRFEYYEEENHSFSSPQNFTSASGDDNLTILDGGFTLSGSPALGKSLTTGWNAGGSLNLGLGTNVCSKGNSLGGSYTYSESGTKEHSIFMDINADGLPDRVFRNGSTVYYRALRFNGNQLEYDTQPQTISGLPALTHTASSSNTWGIEGQVLIVGASASWTKSKNYTDAYFADVNADGYPDYIDNENVYYNMLWDATNPRFELEQPGTTQFIMGDSCNFIIRDGEVNDSIYTPYPDGEDAMYNYERDAVRVWVAPYTGKINISSAVQLIEDTSYSRLQSNSVNGVVYHVQVCSTLYKREEILEDDYSVHSWSQSNINVAKGNCVYFRLLSKGDRKWDDVYWDPAIYYTEINSAAIDTNVTDADGKKIALFRPSQDLQIYDQHVFQAPYSGKIRVKGTIYVDPVADTIFFSLKKGSTTIDQHTFAPYTQSHHCVDDTMTVALNEVVNLKAYTNTNIDWGKISNDFKIYYYYADSVTIDTTSQFDKIEVRPMVQFNMHQKPLQKSKGNSFSSGTWTIVPSITFGGGGSPMNGSLLLTAKTNNQILGKKVINIVNGNIQGSPSIAFTLSSTSTVYFDYYIDSLASSISSAKVKKSGGTTTWDAGLHTYIADSMWKFGNLYRGWGQFSYNDNDTSTFTTITEGVLHLGPLASDTSLIDFDENSISNFYSASNELSAGGANDPLNEPFNMMFPDLDSMVYRDYAIKSYVGKGFLGNFTRSSASASQDTSYDCPIIVVSDPNIDVRTVRKSSIDKNFAWSVSLSLSGLGVGYAHNSTESGSEMDYYDMNGDRYPDLIGLNDVQFSSPQGGVSPYIGWGILDEEMDHSEYVGEGYSIGVELPIAGKSNQPMHSSSGGGGNNSKNTNAKSSASVGLNQYGGSTGTDFTIFDINGDALPDKVYKNGYTHLNNGYGFELYQQWTTDSLNEATGSSIGGSVGFCSNQYSWSGGISLSWSNNETTMLFADMNGDGLADQVRTDAANSQITILLNNGHGFGGVSGTAFSGPDSVSKGKSLMGSVYLSGSGGIPIMGIIKIVINLQLGLSGSVNQTKVMITDFNNDGYQDIVTIDNNSSIVVYFSNLGKINLLKKVTTPTKVSYSMDYTLSTCNEEMPQRKWQMTSLKVFDGFVGDGQDTTYKKFAYGGGYFNRFERQFMGYDSVITMQYNNFNTGSGTCYRSVIEKYLNKDFLFKGLKCYEAIDSATNVKFVETYYTWGRKEITSGHLIPDDSATCYGPYYPAISLEDKYYYNGLSNWQIHTRKKYTHGQYGNIIRYHNYGDMADNGDDIIANIHYDCDTAFNLLAMADSIVVTDTNGTLQRKRTADYDNDGQLIKLNVYTGNDIAVTDLTYDAYGNIASMELPENYNQERMSYQYDYDNTLHTYPTDITDAFGYTTHAVYDYRLGLITAKVDITGNEIYYDYYNDGKPRSVTGPKEIASSAPYTIFFEYASEITVPDTFWARTLHLEPVYQGDYTTLTVSDGTGRIVQTQKNLVEDGVNKWFISGKTTYDGFGRAISVTLPFSVPINNMLYYHTNFPTDKAETTYDVLDRPKLQTAPDQTQTNYQYGFGEDHFSILRFMTVVTDPLNNTTSTYTDPSQKKTTIFDAIGGYTDFAYSVMGELTTSWDPEGNPTEYAYDLAGRMSSRNHPDAGITSYTYDPAGNLLTTQTANLSLVSEVISYEYDYNRLTRVIYPLNPENNVYYAYGAVNEANQTGRITVRQDASGIQKFMYGEQGEIIQNTHTFIVPHGEYYTFETDWTYDCWNRVTSITYPDGELVEYKYDFAGQLYEMTGQKGSNYYQYIDSVFYNMYGQRSRIYYGNGTHAEYTYNALNQRLSALNSYDVSSNLMQELSYTFDDVGNINTIENTAGNVAGDLGGDYMNGFEYDNLYRLTGASGAFDDYTYGTLTYSTSMQYSGSGNITNKVMFAETNLVGNRRDVDYTREYVYEDRPHTVTIAGNLEFRWDANGNMTNQDYSDNDFFRKLCWDEENRLMAVRVSEEELGNNLSEYIYDATGERTWKLAGAVQSMLINGQTMVDYVHFEKTLYCSPLMVMNEQEYTKHFFIEGERICSKIGSGFGDAPIDPLGDPVESLDELPPNEIAENLWTMIQRTMECVGFNPEYNEIDHTLEPAYNTGTEEEKELFYYHPDHLGSSSFVSNHAGEAYQHLQYLPFGESFIDQRHDSPYFTPYTFSAKEKDEETDFSYFGARYYNSEVSIWLSVDPMMEDYPSLSPYIYCSNNPITYVDPDGMYFVGIFGQKVNVRVKKDGSIRLGIFASSDLRRLAKLINKSGSETAKSEFIKTSNNPTKVHVRIFKNKVDNGLYGLHQACDEQGNILEWDEENVKFKGNPAYVKDDSGNDYYKEAYITIFEGNIKNDIDNIRDYVNDQQLSADDAVVGTLSHEEDHDNNRITLDAIKDNQDGKRKIDLWKDVEKPAEMTEGKVFEEIKKNRKK